MPEWMGGAYRTRLDLMNWQSALPAYLQFEHGSLHRQSLSSSFTCSYPISV